MELFDLYDENRQKTGEVIERGKSCPNGLRRLVIHICIFNKKGEMLIQQRHSTKKNWANLWDITLGGCVRAGESSVQAATRELGEELGIKHNFENDRAFVTVNFEGGFDDYYFLEMELDERKVKFPDNEVQAVKWATEKEILAMIKDGSFIEYYPSFISSIFEMRARRGVHSPNLH